MEIISVSHLKKYYRVYKRPPGFTATIKSFFTRNYEYVQAVDDISFQIGKGELVGFIGPNGAGKTTTLKCLSGLLYPTDGNISVLGYTPFAREANYLKKISLIMGQKNQLWWDLPPSETFRLNKEIYDIPDNLYKKSLRELMSLLEADDIIHLPVRKLSLGQRMKMELIAALIHKPEVLFLDEPTIGLDVVMQKKMRDFISEYNHNFKSTILLTSHYMADVKKLCKRVIIINRGKLLYDGSLDQLAKKHSVNKIITVDFSKTVEIEKLKALGSIQSYKFPKLILSVPKQSAKHIASLILSKYPVDDFTIEDPEIEVIIRDVFTRANS